MAERNMSRNAVLNAKTLGELTAAVHGLSPADLTKLAQDLAVDRLKRRQKNRKRIAKYRAAVKKALAK